MVDRSVAAAGMKGKLTITGIVQDSEWDGEREEGEKIKQMSSELIDWGMVTRESTALDHHKLRGIEVLHFESSTQWGGG